MFSTGLGTTEIDNSWSRNCPAASNSQQKGGIFPWEHVLLLAGDPGSAFSQLLFWSPSGEDRTRGEISHLVVPVLWTRSRAIFPAGKRLHCELRDPLAGSRSAHGEGDRMGTELCLRGTCSIPSSPHKHNIKWSPCSLFPGKQCFPGRWGRNVRGAVPPATRFNSAGSLRKCSFLRHGLVSELSLLRGQEC